MKKLSCKCTQTACKLQKMQGAGDFAGSNSLLEEVRTCPVLSHTVNLLTHPLSSISMHKTRIVILSAGEVPWGCPLGSSLTNIRLTRPQGGHLFPHTWAAQHIRQPADLVTQQGKQGSKNTCCRKEWSSLGCAELTQRDAAASMLLSGREGGWPQATGHTSSPAPSPGDVNHFSHMAAGLPWVMPCRLPFDTYGLKMTPQILSVSYSRFFWESMSVRRAVHPSQFPSWWTKLVSPRWVWRNTTNSASPEVFQVISHADIAYDCEIQRYLHRSSFVHVSSMCSLEEYFPIFFKEFYSLIFLKSCDFACCFSSWVSANHYITQLDALQCCAFHWLPNNVH